MARNYNKESIVDRFALFSRLNEYLPPTERSSVQVQIADRKVGHQEFHARPPPSFLPPTNRVFSPLPHFARKPAVINTHNYLGTGPLYTWDTWLAMIISVF